MLFSGKCEGLACDEAMIGQVYGFRNRLSAVRCTSCDYTALPIDYTCRAVANIDRKPTNGARGSVHWPTS